MPSMLLKMAVGEQFDELTPSNQTEIIKLVDLSPKEIETIVTTVDKGQATARKTLSSLISDETDVLTVLHRIGSGEAFSKQHECLCLMSALHRVCPYMDRQNCVGCKYEISTRATFFLLIEEYNRLKNLYLSVENSLEKQKYKSIYSLGPCSQSVAHFICDKCGNDWDSRISYRIKKENGRYRLVGCPKCSNMSFRQIPYSQQYPDLAKMYLEDLNGVCLDSIRGANAVLHTQYHWKCLTCGEEFESTLTSMTQSSKYPTKGCPYCSRTKFRKGESFAELHPELMDEYDPSNTIDAYKIFANCKDFAKWTCRKCNFSWEASFALRHVGGGICPVCNRTTLIKEVNSFAAVYPDMAKFWADSNKRCADEVFSDSSEWFNFICPTCGNEYGSHIKDFVAEEDHHCPFCKGNKAIPGVNSLKALYPQAAKRWSNNNEFDSDLVRPTLLSHFKWICDTCCGEYSASIRDVVSGLDECPYCKGTRVLPGYNSLQDLYPEIARRWSSNNDTEASRILPSAGTPGKWICDTCRGEYSASIRDVVSGFDECPYCKGTRVLPGYNSFADKHPELLNELDSVSNYLLPLTPNEVLDNSIYKFWWVCRKDPTHKYFMSPKTRLMYQKRNREPCLYCRGQRRKLNHFIDPYAIE